MNNPTVGRTAFLLNSNAKSVTPSLKRKLAKLIPPSDLYFSSSLAEAEELINAIIDAKYPYLFCGGGDGTIVKTINTVWARGFCEPGRAMPKVGVLRLGTGNALARLLKAGDVKDDIEHILSGKKFTPVSLNMVQADDGQLTPFAGIGYDGEIMNDFETIKDFFVGSPLKKYFTSFLGFTIAGLFKTLPRQLNKPRAQVILRSSYPAYRIMEIDGQDEEVYLNEPCVFYNGEAPLICVGTIPSVGYDFKMFPFANRRPGYMHLRICAVPLPVCLTHFYPSIWQGTFRHPKLFDYLVKDVEIEANTSLPYQLAGDAMGYKKSLVFKVSDRPVEMVALDCARPNLVNPGQPLMMPLF
jgi:diacylglycerol kinase family enzyme